MVTWGYFFVFCTECYVITTAKEQEKGNLISTAFTCEGVFILYMEDG